MAKALENLHLLPLVVLESKRISPYCHWPDPVWKFDDSTGGSRFVTIHWDFEMPDGSNFMDAKWASLREAAKRFEWSLLVDRRSGGKQLKPISLGKVHFGLRALVYWMALADFVDFGELDNRASKQYLTYIEATKVQNIKSGIEGDDTIDMALDEPDNLDEPEELGEPADDEPEDLDEPEDQGKPSVTEERSSAGLTHYVHPLALLYEQRDVLREAGLPAPTEPPYDGKATIAATKLLANWILNKIPAVPDEVFIPTIKKAVEWLDIPAKDIIRLQSQYVAARKTFEEKYEHTAYSKREPLSSVVYAFEFTHLPDTGVAWHAPIQPSKKGHDQTGVTHLKRLILHLRNACVIDLQGLMGPRISEVSGLQAYPINPDTGMPACVEIRSSRNGLYDVFYVKGRVYKAHAKWKETTWVAGMRLKGTDYVPQLPGADGGGCGAAAADRLRAGVPPAQ